MFSHDFLVERYNELHKQPKIFINTIMFSLENQSGHMNQDETYKVLLMYIHVDLLLLLA